MDPLKILVVDDVKSNRSLLKLLITKLGHQVFEAENGKEAIEINQKEEIDLIFMDIQMPVMDGIEATKIILAESRPNIPFIVAQTGNEEDRHNLDEVGFHFVLTKPIVKDKLEKVFVSLQNFKSKRA